MSDHEELTRLRQKVARVEALADDLTDDEPSGSLSPEIAAWANWAGERIRAALRGTEPTDVP